MDFVGAHKCKSFITTEVMGSCWLFDRYDNGQFGMKIKKFIRFLNTFNHTICRIFAWQRFAEFTISADELTFTVCCAVEYCISLRETMPSGWSVLDVNLRKM